MGSPKGSRSVLNGTNCGMNDTPVPGERHVLRGEPLYPAKHVVHPTRIGCLSQNAPQTKYAPDVSCRYHKPLAGGVRDTPVPVVFGQKWKYKPYRHGSQPRIGFNGKHPYMPGPIDPYRGADGTAKRRRNKTAKDTEVPFYPFLNGRKRWPGRGSPLLLMPCV